MSKLRSTRRASRRRCRDYFIMVNAIVLQITQRQRIDKIAVGAVGGIVPGYVPMETGAYLGTRLPATTGILTPAEANSASLYTSRSNSLVPGRHNGVNSCITPTIKFNRESDSQWHPFAMEKTYCARCVFHSDRQPTTGLASHLTGNAIRHAQVLVTQKITLSLFQCATF